MEAESQQVDRGTIIGLLKKSDKAFEAVTNHYSGQFNYHAAQRLTTFRYFVTAFSIFGAAYATLIAKEPAPLVLPAAGVAFVAFFLVLCFARLDKRNEQIIQINEEPIRQIQREIDRYLVGEGFYSTFDRSDDESSHLMTFGSILPIVFMITAGASLIGAYFALGKSDGGKLQLSLCFWVLLVLLTIAAVYLPFGYRKRRAGSDFRPKLHGRESSVSDQQIEDVTPPPSSTPQ